MASYLTLAPRPSPLVSRPFPLRIEERQLPHNRVSAFAPVLHRDLELDRHAGRVVRRRQMREREILLEQRRPATARRVADLLSTRMDRRARAPRDGRQLRWKPALGVDRL